MPLVILLFALFASLFTLSKTALGYSEPFFLIGSRMVFAGLILLLHQAIFNKANLIKAFSHFIPLLTLGVFSIFVTNISEIWGLQYMTSTKACLIYSLSPFLAALLAFLVLNERLSSKKWVGLFIGFFGILPILFTHTTLQDVTKDLLIFSWPELALVIAALASVYGWILLKKIINQHSLSPLVANGYSMLIGGFLALSHSYFSGEAWNPIPVINNEYGSFIECALWMTLISNLICYNLYGYLLKRYSATFMALAGLVTPLFASLFGWFFLGEVITWHFYVSMSIFSIGLVIFYQDEISNGYLEKKAISANA